MKFALSPVTLFKVDGMGAAISLLLALALLLPLNRYFGFQPVYLGFLILYAALILTYDIHCWRTAGERWKARMRILIALNAGFLLTGLGVLLHPDLRPDLLGVIYLLGEMLIVFALLVLQARSLKEKQ